METLIIVRISFAKYLRHYSPGSDVRCGPFSLSVVKVERSSLTPSNVFVTLLCESQFWIPYLSGLPGLIVSFIRSSLHQPQSPDFSAGLLRVHGDLPQDPCL